MIREVARIILLAGLCVGAGCGPNATSTSPPKGGTPAALTADQLAAATPDVTMTATDWRKVVDADPKAAAEKYGGKVVEVSGEVSSMLDPHGNGVCVQLRTDHKLWTVMAFTADRRLWEKVGVGSKVVVRGLTPAGQKEIMADLAPAVLVSAGPHPAPTLQAVELAKEAATDLEATEKKYEKKSAFLVGEVVQFRPSASNPKSGDLILKGSGEVEVRVFCDSHDVAAAKALKPGVQLKAYGEVVVSKSFDDGKVYVGVSNSLFKAE